MLNGRITAGYNLAEAPKTWWLLAAKKPKPLSEIPMPNESIYAYIMIGSTWRNTAQQIVPTAIGVPAIMLTTIYYEKKFLPKVNTAM